MRTADQYRQSAQEHETEAAASYERCGTDGHLTQWAHGVMAKHDRTAAWLAEQGNRDLFRALFTLDGELVPAKLIHTQYGLTWALLTNDSPDSRTTRFIGAFPKRESTMARKGFYEGYVKAPARVALAGSGTGTGACTTVTTAVERADGGFSRSVEIVDNGIGERPELKPLRR
jgi:hypothetical protein